jgi:mono/diheme cytochrome c family protein
MRAMPQWKYWFDADQRWMVADYVREMLVFPAEDNEPVDPVIPADVKPLKIPPTTSIMQGRAVYLQRCWMCHGDAGQGDGPFGQHLRPTPANFTDPDVKTQEDGELFWKITQGLGNAAMPPWGLLLAEDDRWAALDYIKKTFVNPSEPKEVSDELPEQYQALDSPYPDGPDAQANGKIVYETYCLGCHGKEALGNGEFGAKLMPTPANLAEDPAVSSPAEWWYWRVDQGVVGYDGAKPGVKPHPTAMPAWRFILTDEEKWDVVYYGRKLVGAKDTGGN